MPHEGTTRFVALGQVQGRAAAARELATDLGVDEVLIFIRDPAPGVFIPAPGFAQTIRGGSSWRKFLAACASSGRHAATVEVPRGVHRPAIAITDGALALVLIGGTLRPDALSVLEPLLPLLAAALEAEQQVIFAHAEAAEARAAADRAHALAAALDSARAEGAKLNAKLRDEHLRRDDFLAMLAHELRNPLSPLVTSVELLRRRLPDAASSKQLDIMARQTRQLSRLVEDLLDVSRVRRGRIELRREPVSMAEILADAMDASRPLLEARRHTVHMDLPPDPLYVNADPVRLAQIFANLLHNAAKYTDSGGRIDVVAWRDEDEAVVRFSDNGIGISPEMLPKVFELFAQSPVSLARSQGGLGIGLTLVRALLEQHGGRIDAASAGLGTGSAFTMRLPLTAPPAAHAGARPEADLPAAATIPLRVLIVEDNPDAAESLAEVTRLSGHEVEVVHSGLSALQMAADMGLDLILLDIGLPEMDGYEVARRLRRSVRRDTLLVAITGYGSEEDKRRSREAGFDDHVVKPVMPEALTRVLGRAQRRRQRKAAPGGSSVSAGDLN